MSETSPDQAGPLLEARQLWDQGRHQQAIDRLLEQINRALPAVPRNPGLQLVRYVLELGDRNSAAVFLRRLLEAHPQDPELRALQADLARQPLPSGGSAQEASILAAWPAGPQVSLDPALMPACVSGRVLNLDAAGERWSSMQDQLDRLGWGGTHQRFAATAASSEQARQVGLRSGGELGLWRTTKALLRDWLAQDPGPEAVLHVLEDDAILQPALPQLIEPFHTCEPRVDLLFTEAFLTAPLFQRFRQLELQRQQSGQGLLFVQGQHYLACASSYLLSPTGARIMLNHMEAMEAAGPLLPVDLTYRKLIRSGLLAAAITLPFFSTIADAGASAIQTGLNAGISLAKDADLALRRLLYQQAWDPTAAGAVLRDLADLLARRLAPEQQADLVVAILAHGRSQGWLGYY